MLGVLAKYLQDVSVVRRLIFAVVFLTPDLPMYWGVVLEFATAGKVSKSSITPDQVKALVENIETLDVTAFQTDHTLQREMIFLTITGKKPLGIPLISPCTTCLLCGSKLQLRKDRHAPVVIYDIKHGTIPGAHFMKFCPKTTCSFTQYYGYYSSFNKVMFNPDWNSLEYFLSSRDTGFSLEMLRRVDGNIMIGQLSFKQQASIYNYTNGYEAMDDKVLSSNSLESRQQLDQRRLEEAFMQYALLQVASWYPSSVSIEQLHLHDGLSQTLLSTTPLFHNAFIQRYAKHRCDITGCGEVLILDGNMKNSRQVCFATDAGHTEFSGLPGMVQTGCPNTPAYKSRYCVLHSPTVTTPHNINFTEDGTPVTTGNSEDNKPRHVAMITRKRVTRQSTFYQVVWLGRPIGDCTWEPESNLPQSLVAEYEAGILREIQKDTFTTGGQTVHTLSASATEQNVKRPRTNLSEYTSSLSGSFALPKEDNQPILKCNTEKDVHCRLNHRTAGILAGVWPCGTITILGELFGAESKGQVYGHLHSYLCDNESALSTLSTICYDDACHLKRYACNPVRSALTTTSSRISAMKFAIDRMHFKGHVDPWCRENCDPNRFKELNKVNTEVCEQTFSWMSQYAKITRHMNREHFLFYLLYLSELHNRHKEC